MPDETVVISKLKNAGYKFTRPRRIVVDVLMNAHQHLTAPEIIEQVEAVDESIGRMSIYRTLDLLTRLGIIRPAFQEGTTARYVIMSDGHHHHIICQNCGKVIHFEQCPLGELTNFLESTYNCDINGHLLEFFGTCEDCQ